MRTGYQWNQQVRNIKAPELPLAPHGQIAILSGHLINLLSLWAIYTFLCLLKVKDSGKKNKWKRLWHFSFVFMGVNRWVTLEIEIKNRGSERCTCWSDPYRSIHSSLFKSQPHSIIRFTQKKLNEISTVMCFIWPYLVEYLGIPYLYVVMNSWEEKTMCFVCDILRWDFLERLSFCSDWSSL